MQIVGFNFKKISAERVLEEYLTNVNYSIDFLNIEKIRINSIEKEVIKFYFSYLIKYSLKEDSKKQKENKKSNEVCFEGEIFVSTTEQESEIIFKSWKKKEVPLNIKIFLINFILRKCAPIALMLEDEVNIPYHMPVPQLSQIEDKK